MVTISKTSFKDILHRLRLVSGIVRRHPFVTAAVGVCILGLVIWGVVALRAAEPDVKAGPVLGEYAPDFTLQTIAGESVTLADFRGKIVILGFSGLDDSWLDDETGRGAYFLQAVHAGWQDDELILLEINAWSDPAEIQEYIASNGLTFPVRTHIF